jgi:hypothetical protein
MATDALTVTIGSDTVHNTNGNVNVPDDIQVSDFGRLAFQGNTMGGSGPLDGFNATAFFRISSDPAFAARSLPFPFRQTFSDPGSPSTRREGSAPAPSRSFRL